MKSAPNAATGPMPVDEAIRTLKDYARYIRGEVQSMPTTCTKARKVRAIEALVRVAERAEQDRGKAVAG